MKRMILNRKCILAILAVLCFGFMTAAAEAFSIGYQFGGTGVFGDVDGAEFNDASFLVSIVGDTLNVIEDALGPVITGLTGTIVISGGDLTAPISGAFLDPLYVYVDPSLNSVGFGSDVTGFDQLSIFYPGVGLYDLQSLFGPIFAGFGLTDTAIFNAIGADMDFGVLTVDTVTNGSFQAVPVPAPVLLLASGLIGLVAVRRKASA